MNNLLKLFIEINKEAFITVKKCEYAVRGFIKEKQIDAVIKRFNASERDDVNTDEIPVISFSEYPTVVDLTRYVRNEFGDKLPEYIESNQEKHKLVLKLIAITEDEAINRVGVIGINNGYNKIYNYQEYIIENCFN